MIKLKEQDEIKGKETINDEIEWRKYLIDVQSEIKNNITSDLTLAKLDEQDKEGIIEMTTNAYFCERQLELLKAKSYIWKWKQNKWIKEKITKDEEKSIDIFKKDTFNSFMIRIQMTMNANRNREGNYLINVLTNNREEMEKQEENVGIMEKIKERLQPNER